MSTTLEAELEQAAKRSDWLAFQCTPQAVGAARSIELRGIHEAEAARIRQRAAWVRELEGSANFKAFNLTGREVLRLLTGPIPETAPTERKGT